MAAIVPSSEPAVPRRYGAPHAQSRGLAGCKAKLHADTPRELSNVESLDATFGARSQSPEPQCDIAPSQAWGACLADRITSTSIMTRMCNHRATHARLKPTYSPARQADRRHRARTHAVYCTHPPEPKGAEAHCSTARSREATQGCHRGAARCRPGKSDGVSVGPGLHCETRAPRHEGHRRTPSRAGCIKLGSLRDEHLRKTPPWVDRSRRKDALDRGCPPDIAPVKSCRNLAPAADSLALSD